METLSVILERDPQDGSGWKVRRVNGVEQSEWRQGHSYSSLDIYCAEEAKRGGWKNAGVDHDENDASVTFWR